MTTPERTFNTEITYIIDDFDGGQAEEKTIDLKTLTEEELFQIFFFVPEAADEIAYRSLYLDAKNHNTNS